MRHVWRKTGTGVQVLGRAPPHRRRAGGIRQPAGAGGAVGTLTRVPRSRSLVVVLLVLAVPFAAACGGTRDGPDAPKEPTSGAKGEEAKAAEGLGFPAFATKNTTRVGGGDPTADAAAIARA